MIKNSHNIKVLKPWGNYKKVKSKAHSLIEDRLPKTLGSNNYIVFANGRSYGDCNLNENTVTTNNFNRIISFDKKKGIIQCQSGVLFSDILDKVIPEKWFLPVTPGTKFVTVGGAIAADVHGKNHHKVGCFSEFVLSLLLLLPDGSVVTCSKTENVELFRATCGGMGLTGVIVEATIQLIPIDGTQVQQTTIATNSLEETFNAFKTYEDTTYVVAWLDVSSKKTGKGIILLGEHSKDEKIKISTSSRISIPNWFPSFFLNPLSIKWYNTYYYIKHKNKNQEVSLDAFFYPLDSIKNWNRLYGKKGFIQYQIVVPKEDGFKAISHLLETIKKSNHTSYLTILKLMREANSNYLSFPLEGYTIALDFKVKKGLWDFLDTLDHIVLSYNGRAYLAKDGRMKTAVFEKGYPYLKEFKLVRKKYKLNTIQSQQSKRLGL